MMQVIPGKLHQAIHFFFPGGEKKKKKKEKGKKKKDGQQKVFALNFS